MDIIETTGLGKRYGRTWALKNCTLAIPGGHVVALVGPNGAGKSTLLNMAMGLANPTAGRVTVLGGVPAGSPAALDPLARHDFMQSVLSEVAAEGISVVLSSHVVAELEQVADYLVVLGHGTVLVSGEVSTLTASHGAGLEKLVLGYLREGSTEVAA